jgi:tRNA-splicing ligase RtcB (3'-phosphate/5'-hydroxy nucleic acid ligase)
MTEAGRTHAKREIIMADKNTDYEVHKDEGAVPIKSWTRGVAFEQAALDQLRNVARLPFIHKWVAVMPDVHAGLGATIGSVVPTHKAIIPAAVGVDIGCGMMAAKTSLSASELPDSLRPLRNAIERAVPHGRTANGGANDRGAWGRGLPELVGAAWTGLEQRFKVIQSKHPKLARANTARHLGTLGTGNHFIELCLDTEDAVWVMLHSGSRGVGNAIGRRFIALAKEDMERWHIHLPDTDLAYLPEGSRHFDDYVEAVDWAQDYARQNREIMMQRVVEALRGSKMLPGFEARLQAVNCHHNYVARERHFGAEVYVTRKGAVRAGEGEMGIIPGSMGARSYIVRGKGNKESFESCSHGAGRAMSRGEAKRRFSLAEHLAATEGVECRKDAAVIDETPMAYKPIDRVMAAQASLVEVVAELRQVICVKG